MTKRLSKAEKAARAKLSAVQRHLAANIKAKVNAKKKAGGLSRSERADMNAAVAYIKLTNYSSANDVCSNVKRLGIYSRACEAIANAEERGLVRGHRHPGAPGHEEVRYYPAGGKAPVEAKKEAPARKKAKPKKKAPDKRVWPPNMNKADADDMEEVLQFIDLQGYQSIDGLIEHWRFLNSPGLKRRADFQRAVGNGVRLGWLRKKGEYYYSISKEEWKKIQAKEAARKAVPKKLSNSDLQDMDIVVDYILRNCPDDSTPVTTEQLDNGSELSRSAARRACMNGVKLGRLVRDDDGYRLAKGYKGAKSAKSKFDRAPHPWVKGKPTPLQYAEAELLRCKEQREYERKQDAEQHERTTGLWKNAEAKGWSLQKQITGWELRNNVQVATYRLERHEAGLMRDGVGGLVDLMDAWQKKMNEFFTAKPGNKRTVDEWRGWASEQARELVQIKAAAEKCKREPPAVMTEAVPARLRTEAMLMTLMGLPDPVGGRGWSGDTGPGEDGQDPPAREGKI